MCLIAVSEGACLGTLCPAGVALPQVLGSSPASAARCAGEPSGSAEDELQAHGCIPGAGKRPWTTRHFFYPL